MRGELAEQEATAARLAEHGEVGAEAAAEQVQALAREMHSLAATAQSYKAQLREVSGRLGGLAAGQS